MITIKDHKQYVYLFGLDSFHFQGKIIDIEYDDMKRLYYAITNRIYCEYFKLYKIVVEYIIENITDDKKLLDLVSVNNNFPIYKDLEPFKQYNFEIIHKTSSTDKKLIWDMERKFINKFKEYSYKPKIDFGGKTECFTIEILNNF